MVVWFWFFYGGGLVGWFSWLCGAVGSCLFGVFLSGGFFCLCFV